MPSAEGDTLQKASFGGCFGGFRVGLRWHTKERFKAVLAGSEWERAASRSCSRVLHLQALTEDTGTCPSLHISCWFVRSPTQSVLCHVKIRFVDASYPTR